MIHYVMSLSLFMSTVVAIAHIIIIGGKKKNLAYGFFQLISFNLDIVFLTSPIWPILNHLYIIVNQM